MISLVFNAHWTWLAVAILVDLLDLELCERGHAFFSLPLAEDIWVFNAEVARVCSVAPLRHFWGLAFWHFSLRAPYCLNLVSLFDNLVEKLIIFNRV